MRALSLLFSAACNAELSESKNCSNRNIKLWLHLDLTNSFSSFLQQSDRFFRETLTTLPSKYPNLIWGASGFADRTKTPGQNNDRCFIAGTSFQVVDADTKIHELDILTGQIFEPTTNVDNDPFSGVPYIAKQHFGDYIAEDNELRLLCLLTDTGPHFSPQDDGNAQSVGNQDFDKDPTDYVTCDSNYKWLNLTQIFDPLKNARVYPVVALYPATAGAARWQRIFESATYPSAYVREFKTSYNPAEFVEFISSTIDKYQCDDPPTDQPVNTTTAEPTTAPSTTTMPSTTVTVTEPQSTTTAAASESKKPVVIGAATGAGLFAALTAFGAYRRTEYVDPFDIQEAETSDTHRNSGHDREMRIRVNEAAYSR